MQGLLPDNVATLAIDFSYLLVAFLFIMGLKRMSSPVTARRGIVVAGVGMLIATLMSFLYPGMGNFPLMLAAIAVGGGLAWWSGRIVAMTDMPQMIALYNGMGGGAAAAIAAVELLRMASADAAAAAEHGPIVTALAAAGAFIGAVSFSRLAHRLRQAAGPDQAQLPLQGPAGLQPADHGGDGRARRAGIVISGHPTMEMVILFFGLALLLGVTMTLPIGGADMPVVISLYNALHRPRGRLRRLRARERGDDHRRHRGRLRRHAADAVDGESDEPLARQRAVLGLRRRTAAAAAKA